MPESDLTVRQQIKAALRERPWTAYELAAHLKISVRDVENHLAHVIRSIHHDKDDTFCMEVPECRNCHFRFRNRARITAPSRCPRCRSEDITSPRFSISTG